MIVGLGDYSGGELAVEGVPHDIRYQPMEFNGWTQRHWTLPFEGERFSLVWFTPLGCEDMPGLDICRLGAGRTAEAVEAGIDSHAVNAGEARSEEQCLCLANGVQIPQLSFGIGKLGAADACEEKVAAALEAGFRGFDTAAMYKNEVELGAALQ